MGMEKAYRPLKVGYLLCCVFTFWISFCHKFCANGGFIVPPESTEMGCVEEGSSVSYQCTAMDHPVNPIGSTIWLGSAFDCPSSGNQISLPHFQFSNGLMLSCGELTAMSTSFDGGNYTSELSFTAMPEMNGQMINCTIGAMIIGSANIITGVRPPSPRSVVVSVDSSSSLTVSWTPPANISNVAQYLFSVTGDCNCVDTTTPTTSVACSGWTADNQTCTFTISSISTDCGFTSASAVGTSVTLSIPSSPDSLVLTNQRETCAFSTSTSILMWNNPTDSSVPPVMMYQVMVSSSSMEFTSTGQSISIPGSIFLPGGAGTYSFSVSAVNIFGETSATQVDGEVSLADLMNTGSALTEDMTGITLTYSISNTGCNDSSLIVYYERCTEEMGCQCSSDFTGSSETVIITGTVMDVTLSGLEPLSTYCYRSELRTIGVVVSIGVHSSLTFETRAPSMSLSLGGIIGIIVGILVVLFLLVVIVPIVAYAIYKLYKRREKCENSKGTTPPPPPPPDSLYADPNAIEHTTAPGTETEYAMVDRGVKEKKKKKPTQQEALYQDPGTIEHETTATGAEYALIDKSKPKKASKKNQGPDVVPGPNEGGLTYADIEVTSKPRAQRSSQRQAQEPVGTVEYAVVSTENATMM